ncbi:RNA polymerase sigma factor, sigma-70 family [Sinomicrobium oceani]|uniref:RNA polymerase sigma factor, sigma-70 family n=1 Tax=Sinomicrobium oceani TaxID=1150368 RepID=A0A1K1RWY1_9FLAO|nr:sigma-70 family RNA polymerase sigma factor [Sinomicrobium oceani]SFW76325.1 RNA polymerase sigma factor, sigma-70 family [Sinomicrobium oceani]
MALSFNRKPSTPDREPHEIPGNGESVVQNQTDTELWRAFREGSESAFASIYNRNFNILFRYGLKQVRDRELVGDAIQDLFVELWETRERLGDVRIITHYLLTCIRRKVVARAIKAGKRSLVPVDELLEGEPVPSLEHLLVERQAFDQRRKEVRHAVSQLNTNQQEIIFLKFHCRIDYPEIAEIMDTDTKSVYNLMARTMKRLRDHFGF